MQKLILAIGLTACLTLPTVAAEEISLAIEGQEMLRSYMHTIVKATNNGDRNFEHVFVSCAFLDNSGQAITLSKAWFIGLSPGQSKRENVSTNLLPALASIECQVDQAY